MGRDVPAMTVSRQDRRAYREKVRQCLDVFARMLRESRFETEPQVGLEIEVNLVDHAALPSMRNTEVLAAIDDPAWASELGQFNLEINVPPRPLPATRCPSWRPGCGTAWSGPARAPARQAAGWS